MAGGRINPRPLMSSSAIRQRFLDFFAARGHTPVPSSPVVLPSASRDDSIAELFVNAGMVQFKPYLLGEQRAPWSRAVNAQKCIRLGGKHNDLAAVGRDTYHHTFFEMLGNWSFGSHQQQLDPENHPPPEIAGGSGYGRAEACRFAWAFLTDELGLDPRSLYVTYFVPDVPGGEEHQRRQGKGKGQTLAADLETREIWLQIGEMGVVGPCGRCSEIHVDRQRGREKATMLVNTGDPTIQELWNLVFMEKRRLADGSLEELPVKNVDCGLGFERLVSVLQGVPSAYDSDLFTPLLATISDAIENSVVQQHKVTAPGRPYMGLVGSEADPHGVDTAYRIVADHMRTLTVALADGVDFEGRQQGEDLRRLLRRACFYANEHLGLHKRALPDLFAECARVVGRTLGCHYAELGGDGKNVERCVAELRAETRRFWSKIEKLRRSFRAKADRNGGTVTVAEAFRLHRNGMPVAWLRDAARQHSAQVDWAGLETEIRRFERHQHDPDYREEQQGQGEGKEEEGEQRRDVDEEDEEGK